ncbi:MAG: two-component system response regulator [Pirellula sp.]|nr:two-component system response regulator [Pirellula sp.]
MSHHVLVVDDSPSIRRMIAVTLAAEGFEVSPCSSGVEAIKAAKAKAVDVVVTDLNMPEIDGLELTRQLRLLPNTSKCPILILTTETSAARKDEAKTAGANGWILKPFREEALVRAIRSVCQRTGATA